jgi:hypothetical protein
LVNSKEVSCLEFKKVFKEVEGADIFAYHHKTRTVTFQSRPIELYIKENISNFRFPQTIQENADKYIEQTELVLI